MLHYLKDRVFGITPPLDNVSFIRNQEFLIVHVCLFVNFPTKMLELLTFYMDIIYWLPWDDLIGKRQVKSACPRSFGVKGVNTAPHSCVFFSWYGDTSSRDYLVFMGYSRVDFNLFFKLVNMYFAVAMGSWICRKIVVESRTGHPIKSIF